MLSQKKKYDKLYEVLQIKFFYKLNINLSIILFKMALSKKLNHKHAKTKSKRNVADVAKEKTGFMYPDGRSGDHEACTGPGCDKPVEIPITDKSPHISPGYISVGDPMSAADLPAYMYPFPTGIPFRVSLENLLTFNDLSDEKYRVYDFGTHKITLDNPMKLNVSENGHRVYTADGISHYIPKGWIHLYWKVRYGCPHFAF